MPLILGAQSAIAAGEYSIDNSCRFNDGDSAYLHFTQGTPTDNLKWTANVWFKMGVLPPADTAYLFSAFPSAGNIYSFRFTGTDNAQLDHDNYISSSHVGRLETDGLFRDASAWYCATIVYDSANGVAGDRMKMYINGTEETSFAVDTNPSLNEASVVNADTVSMQIGRRSDGGYFDGYMAELAFCDGQVYAASDFGEFNADSPTLWQPKDISGLTFGNNGFHLDFEDSADLGKDVSGNGNDFTVVNLTATDQATDTPVNNFATLNPLGMPLTNPATLSEGNCKIVLVGSSDADWGGASTIGLSAGKWYWEIKPSNDISSSGSLIGVTDDPAEVVRDSTQELTLNIPIGYAYKNDGNKRVNVSGSEVSSSYGDSYTNDDIIGVALNMDDLELKFYKNNAVQDSGTAISMIASTHSGFYFPGASKTGTATCTFEWNFGGCSSFAITSEANDENGYGVFEYAPPSGFLAICTKNLGSDGG